MAQAQKNNLSKSISTPERVFVAQDGILWHSEMNLFERRAAGFVVCEHCPFPTRQQIEDAYAALDAVLCTKKGSEE